MSIRYAVLLALLFASPFVVADEAEAEIEYLVSTIGSSDCTFIRNGKRYGASDAEAHLRMKYRRGKRYAPTAEKFIERLASESSMSKKPYFIDCDGAGPVPTSEWLTSKLDDYRRNAGGMSVKRAAD